MRKLTATFIFLYLFFTAAAQNAGVGIGTTSPHTSAVLELKDTVKGFLPPRLTYAQRISMGNPAAGLVIWCSDCLPKGEMQVYNGIKWTNFMGGDAAVNFVQMPSISIGSQTWSLMNLDVSFYRNGDPIPKVTDATQWSNLTTGAWCWYNNDSLNYGAVYGKLYNWYAVTDPRGLAPIGWRVPSLPDWNVLTMYLDPSADTSCNGCYQSLTAGGAMKQTGTLRWNSPNVGATNSSGFTALPGGYRRDFGDFSFVGMIGSWWTTSEWSPTFGWSRPLNNSDAATFKSAQNKREGYSVRLIKQW